MSSFFNFIFKFKFPDCSIWLFSTALSNLKVKYRVSRKKQSLIIFFLFVTKALVCYCVHSFVLVLVSIKYCFLLLIISSMNILNQFISVAMSHLVITFHSLFVYKYKTRSLITNEDFFPLYISFNEF